MSISSTSSELTSFLPNLPGFRTKTANSGQKKRFFKVLQGQNFSIDNPDQFPILTSGGFASIVEDHSITTIGTCQSVSTSRLLRYSLENAGIILTYFAYFEESSSFSTSPIDEKRVRKCTIFYYLENGTLSIVEKTKANSGMPQGTIVRRAVVNKPDGTPYMPEDIHVGDTLNIYGRTFRVYDCDEATRQFMVRNFEDPEIFPVSVPSDPYEEYRKTLERNNTNDWSQYRTKRFDHKVFMEAQLGNTVNNKGREGFIRYGNMKLNFRCVWDSRDVLYGDRNEFTMSYHLSDDTIEIFSVPKMNASRDVTSRLLKRSKLPKRIPQIGVATETHDSVDTYHWRDLAIGLELQVYARVLRVVDADPKTRQFYLEQGMPLRDAEPEPEKVTLAHEREIPPPTGFGSEEDSLRSCTGHLNPGPMPQKKLRDHKILSFLASLISNEPNDDGRRFILTYYVSDSTLRIREPPIRNSGFLSGEFMSRRAVKLTNGETLTERHLFLGCKLQVLKYQFRILSAAEDTLRWMEDHRLPMSSFYLVLGKIRRALLADARSGSLEALFSRCQSTVLSKPESSQLASQPSSSPSSGPSLDERASGSLVELEDGLCTTQALRAVLSQYGLLENEELTTAERGPGEFLCEHEFTTIERSLRLKTGSKLGKPTTPKAIAAVSQGFVVLNYRKVIEQIISPNDELK